MEVLYHCSWMRETKVGEGTSVKLTTDVHYCSSAPHSRYCHSSLSSQKKIPSVNVCR